MVQLPVSLVQGNNQQTVAALLLDLELRHVADFQSLWQAQLRQFSQKDKYWDWAFKEQLTLRDANIEDKFRIRLDLKPSAAPCSTFPDSVALS